MEKRPVIFWQQYFGSNILAGMTAESYTHPLAFEPSLDVTTVTDEYQSFE